MNKFVKSLFLFCVFITTTNPSFSEEEVVQTQTSEYDLEPVNTTDADMTKILVEKKELAEGRSTADDTENSDSDSDLKKHSKPLRSIFLGIYKNYKSTYLGNKTITEYKQTLREKMKNKQQQVLNNDADTDADVEDDEVDGIVTAYPFSVEEETMETTTTETIVPQPPANQKAKVKLSPNRKRKLNVTQSKTNLQHYHVGPALNLSLDMNNSIVKVNLDGESLTELVTGRWLNDNTEEGRGKKYDMMTRVLPLFILPFLIQSAIVPFLVTKLKLLLMKSILVGKLAIFLLIISAFRNSNKQMQTYEVAPSYWASEPSRRSELAAASSNMAYNGYRVEGKPAAWVN